LEDGGRAFGETPSILADVRILSSCYRSCSQISGCKDEAGGCGICSCTIDNYPSAISTWSRKESQLFIDGLATEYCVSGTKLSISVGEAVYAYERVILNGTPEFCSTRDLDQCIGPGCRIGQCVGEPRCTTADNQPDCSVLQGCSWDESVCSGEAPTQCGESDWGKTPGCRVDPYPVGCTGEAPICALLDRSACEDIPGCSSNGACHGYATGECSDFPADCELLVGCEPDGVSFCKGGTPTCEQQAASEGCLALGCRWVDCVGVATPCATLDVATCESTSYCSPVYE
jgi:hypothetical protein